MFLISITLVSGGAYDAYYKLGGSNMIWIEACADKTLGSNICVRDLRTNTDDYHGLQIGDQILEMGGVPALPSDQIAFRHALLSSFDDTMIVKRQAETLTLTLPKEKSLLGWFSVGKNLMLCMLGLIISIFAKPSRLALSAIAILFVYVAGGQGASVGPTPLTAEVLVLVFCLGIMILYPALLCFSLLVLKPNITGSKLTLCGLAIIPGILLLNVYYGWPISPYLAFQAFYVSILVFVTTEVGIIVFWYRATTGRARRLANWLVLGVSLSTLIWGLAYLIGLYQSDAKMTQTFIANDTVSIVTALLIACAILKDDAIEINKAAVISSSYTIVAVLLALIYEFVLEPLVALTSESLGIESDIGQTLVIVAIALSAPRLKAAITPRMEKLILDPERNGNSGDSLPNLHV